MIIAYIASIVSGPILFPGGLLSWLFVGLIAGFLASAVVRGRGYGCIGNIIIGLVGAVIGGLPSSLLSIQGPILFLGSGNLAFLRGRFLVAGLLLFFWERGR